MISFFFLSFPARTPFANSVAAARRILPALLLCLACSGPALYAQSSASVSGTVTDPTGAVIPGAQIVLTNTDTNVATKTATNGSGAYSITGIVPGNYSIKVTRDGFETATEKSIVLQVGQAALFNFKLVPGQVKQSVTVVASAATEETTTATLGTVIPTKSVNDIPLNSRNFTELLELTPGVSRLGDSQAVIQNGGQTSHIVGTYTLPSVNGMRNRSDMYLLDGGNDLNSYNGAYNYEPIVDDIQEFMVQSHSDLAEYGQETGAIVNVVTKSGTNQWHGSLWEFLRNSATDARNYFQKSVNPLRQNQFGGTFGGPVMLPHLYNGRNRTFFFFAYEGYRQSQANQSVFTTPTPAQLTGDFSNLYAKGVLLYNPYSTTPDTANPGKYTRQAFPDDQIPSNLLDPAALAYAKALFPAPQTGVIGGNAYDNQPIYTDYDSYTGRLDQALGANDSFFVRVSEFNEPYTSSGGVPAAQEQNVVRGYNITAHEVHTFGSTATLETYFTRNYGDLLNQMTYPGAPNLQQTLEGAGFSSSLISGFVTPSTNVIPEISITGYASVAGTAYEDTTGSDIYEYGAAFSKIIGKHTMKVGGSFSTNNYHEPIVQSTEAMTTFQTSNLETPTVNGVQTGDALASFLLGAPDSAVRRSTLESEHGGYVTGGYVQDQIKALPNLDINVGARWDMTKWPVYGSLSNGVGYVGNMDFNNGIYYITAVPPACSATQGAPCIPGGVLPAHVEVTPNKDRSLHNTDYSDWQWRLGLAYQLSANTSLHAGYGRYYDEWSWVDQAAQDSGGLWPSVTDLVSSNLNQTTVTAPIVNPLNLAPGALVPAATPFTTSGEFVYWPGLLSPYSDQWNLGFERSFGTNTNFKLTYVGSVGRHLVLSGYANTATYPAAGTAAQVASRYLYPYAVPEQYYDSGGNSNYNALEVSLNKHQSKGIYYLVSYTWSKSIDLACSDTVNKTGCILENWYDPQMDRSVSGFDLTDMFSASVLYQLPFGSGRMYNLHGRLMNAVAGGWQLNGITYLSSGTPYSVTVNGDIENTGNVIDQADLVGTPNPPQRSASEWINKAAFQSPPADTYGTFGRNALRSNWYRDVDLSMFKNFPLKESAYLQFRADAFDAFNDVVFDAPTATVGSPTFGEVTDAIGNPREFQFALKLEF